MRCRICGREGFDICPECQFKEQNQQCWRCRMYIPKAEMQQWRGQWICPNCRMDLEREESETGAERKREEDAAQAETREKKGRCDRCGRETLILYRFNNRNLCWYCLEKEDTYGGAGGTGGAIPIQLTRERKGGKGLLKMIKEFLFGKGPGGEGEPEIAVARAIPIRKIGGEGEIAPVKKEGAETREEKREEPEKEEKKTGKEEKKKPEWGQWKED